MACARAWAFRDGDGSGRQFNVFLFFSKGERRRRRRKALFFAVQGRGNTFGKKRFGRCLMLASDQSSGSASSSDRISQRKRQKNVWTLSEHGTGESLRLLTTRHAIACIAGEEFRRIQITAVQRTGYTRRSYLSHCSAAASLSCVRSLPGAPGNELLKRDHVAPSA